MKKKSPRRSATPAVPKLRIGWIGLGRMGEAMVQRLHRAGCGVAAWNRTRSKAAALEAEGVEIVERIAALSGRDVVFTMVSATEDLKQVLLGKGGLLTGKKRPKLVVDCSSISDVGSAEVRRAVEAPGVGYLCAPVSGSRNSAARRRIEPKRSA